MKKKGLIVATIVMVLVLAVSLSTATYAWFSSQAQATVDDLTIKTHAEAGLQIAMTNEANSITSIYSGDLSYADGKWTGTEGWGTYLGFTSIEVGEIEHAATYKAAGETIELFNGYKKATGTFNASTTYYTMTAAEFGTDKYVETDGLWNLTTDASSQEDTTYYTLAKVENADANIFSSYYVVSTESKKLEASDAGYYQPTGYDNKMEPTGYVKVAANQKGTLYYLTMVVTNTKDIGALGMSIEVTPAGITEGLSTKAISAENPGMAAASRIEMQVTKGSETSKVAKTTLAPFSGYKLTNAKTMSATDNNGWTESKDGAKNTTGAYTCTIDYAETTSKINANSVYYINMYIWVEGTDEECCNDTTGTEMTFQINFTYVDESHAASELEYDFANDSVEATVITLSFN